MDSLPSLSKGVFVNKPKSKPSPSKLKQSDTQKKKLKQFHNVWDKMETKILEICNEIHQEAARFVVNFVQNSGSSSQFNPALQLGALPTVALIMGVNMTDHCSLFGLLSTSLEEAGALVSFVKSADSSSLPAITHKVVHSFTHLKGEDFNLKRKDYTFEMLVTWYEDRTSPLRSSPRKKQKVSRSPLVIVLEDIEAFPSHVLQQFILICHHYLDQLPLVLVLGVATAMVTVHSLLPLKVTSCLAINVYTSPAANQLLSSILQQVLITSELPFRLGPKVFKFLTDTIIYHDFSVSNLAHILKFCVLEHYVNNPASALIYETMATQAKMVVNNLPSFHKYLEDSSEQDNIDMDKVNVLVNQLLECLASYNEHLSLALDCLHALGHDLPGQPLGKQRRELYSLFLEQRITETEEYKTAFKLLRMMSLDELHGRLVRFLAVFPNPDISGYFTNTGDQESAQILLDHLAELVEGPEEEEPEEHERNKKTETKLVQSIQGKITRHVLQEHLLKASKQRPPTKFELWRNELVQGLDEFFRLLPAVSSVALHEAVYFDNLSTVKSRLNASPRMTIHNALVDPRRYLQCKCCVLKDEGDISKCLPAISLTYKLMLEGGKLINIYDWLQSYLSLRNQEFRSPRKKGKDNNQQNQAEFFQAVSELQLLGIVKSNKRKTDHVARLTWASC